MKDAQIIIWNSPKGWLWSLSWHDEFLNGHAVDYKAAWVIVNIHIDQLDKKHAKRR